MRFDIQLHSGELTSEHQLEFARPSVPQPTEGGRVQYLLNGETKEADWVEVSSGLYSIILGGRSYEVWVTRDNVDLSPRRQTFIVTVGPQSYRADVRDPRRRGRRNPVTESEGPKELLAPMPGKIVKILVSESQEVRRDEGLLVIEAMKMQNELRAPRSGRVEKIYVREGLGVETGFKLLRLA